MVTVIAAEPSKTPFIVAGAVLVIWAVILAVVGTRNEGFASAKRASRGVMGVSALLVAVTMVTAVLTASTPPPRASAATGAGGAAAATNSASIAADKSSLAYSTKQLALKAGQDTIQFDNPSPIPHNVTVADSSGKVIGATKTVTGGKATASLTLQPGSYVFYCSVDGHRAAGMQGTLTVR